jgi:hypothetical protein
MVRGKKLRDTRARLKDVAGRRSGDSADWPNPLNSIGLRLRSVQITLAGAAGVKRALKLAESLEILVILGQKAGRKEGFVYCYADMAISYVIDSLTFACNSLLGIGWI